MNKQEFLSRLEQALSGLPAEELQERLAFYRESIEDRVEEGLSEEASPGSSPKAAGSPGSSMHSASARHNRFLIRLIIFSNRFPGSCPLPCRKGAGPASSQCITELFYHASVEMQGKRRDRRRETDLSPSFFVFQAGYA